MLILTHEDTKRNRGLRSSGSDNPFAPLAEAAEGMMQAGFSAADRQLIGHDNALALLPRLKTR